MRRDYKYYYMIPEKGGYAVRGSQMNGMVRPGADIHKSYTSYIYMGSVRQKIRPVRVFGARGVCDITVRLTLHVYCIYCFSA